MFHLSPAVQAFAFGTSGYAVGALSAAYYVVRAARGTDIRALHSGNAGATNAGRVLGRRGFVLVFALDCLKGAVAVWLPRLVEAPPEVCGVAALMVVAGHVWPPQLHFRGGKGIATAIGAVPVATPWLALHLLLVAAATVLATRRPHLAGLAAVVALVPVARGLGLPGGLTATLVALVLVILWAHRRDLSAALPVRRDGATTAATTAATTGR
ncbi:MAG: glycerol-3-phosphate acyltransferase [Gemmatimonadota bacterium]